MLVSIDNCATVTVIRINSYLHLSIVTCS